MKFKPVFDKLLKLLDKFDKVKNGIFVNHEGTLTLSTI